MTPVIETSKLTKRFGSHRGVEDLDLVVHEAEIFGFLGPNGAGKSTTIRLLLGMVAPTSGFARVLGLSVARDPVEVHRRTGYLSGELALFPGLTARQHIEWFARARGIRAQMAEQLVERFHVEMSRPARELSKGNRQKIGLVLAFMHQPELVVLDEPTSGLDPLMQDEFHQLLRETVADGATVFLSSHELDEVQRVATRVAIIKEGALVVTDSVEALQHSLPQTVRARFHRPVLAADFEHIEGVQSVSIEGPFLELQLVGTLGPALKVVAEHDPVELDSRPADLEELFLGFYRDTPEKGPQTEVRHGY